MVEHEGAWAAFKAEDPEHYKMAADAYVSKIIGSFKDAGYAIPDAKETWDSFFSSKP